LRDWRTLARRLHGWLFGPANKRESPMYLPILHDRKSYDDARLLIDTFGEEAGLEAATRADVSRELGNHLRFCHWRQIERMIVIMTVEQAFGTIH
jgi:hypothetical protein